MGHGDYPSINDKERFLSEIRDAEKFKQIVCGLEREIGREIYYENKNVEIVLLVIDDRRVVGSVKQNPYFNNLILNDLFYELKEEYEFKQRIENRKATLPGLGKRLGRTRYNTPVRKSGKGVDGLKRLRQQRFTQELRDIVFNERKKLKDSMLEKTMERLRKAQEVD